MATIYVVVDTATSMPGLPAVQTQGASCYAVVRFGVLLGVETPSAPFLGLQYVLGTLSAHSQDKTTCGPCRLKRLIREKILSTNASPHPCDQFQTNSNRVFLEELVILLGGRWVASSLPYLLMHYVPPRLQGPCSHESSPLRLPCPRGWVTCLV